MSQHLIQIEPRDQLFGELAYEANIDYSNYDGSYDVVIKRIRFLVISRMKITMKILTHRFRIYLKIIVLMIKSFFCEYEDREEETPVVNNEQLDMLDGEI